MEIVPSDICPEQIPLCATHGGINETDTYDLRDELEQALTNHGYTIYDDYYFETEENDD